MERKGKAKKGKRKGKGKEGKGKGKGRKQTFSNHPKGCGSLILGSSFVEGG